MGFPHMSLCFYIFFFLFTVLSITIFSTISLIVYPILLSKLQSIFMWNSGTLFIILRFIIEIHLFNNFNIIFVQNTSNTLISTLEHINFIKQFSDNNSFLPMILGTTKLFSISQDFKHFSFIPFILNIKTHLLIRLQN